MRKNPGFQSTPTYRRKGKFAFSALAVCFASLALAQSSAVTPKQDVGVIPLPYGAPNTDFHTVIPAPVREGQKALHPLEKSPKLAEIDSRLAKGPITLKDALSIALAANPVIAQSIENLSYAEGRLGVAKSAFLPSLTAGSGEAYIKRIAAPVYGVQAALPIDISHLLSAATEQAHFQEIEAILGVNQARNDVMYGVASAFYDALRAQALVDVAQENLNDSLERLHDTQVRYNARAVAYFDVIRGQTDVANAQKELIQSQNGVKNALAVLAQRMGIDIGTSLSLSPAGAIENPLDTGVKPAEAPTVPPAEIPVVTPMTPDKITTQPLGFGPEYQAVLTQALEQRPEILAADANIAAAKKGVLIARRSELPSLAIGLGYYYLRTQSGTQVNEPQAFIGVNVPIFDGGEARAKVQEARSSVASAVTSKRQEVDAVTLDVQQAYLALEEARDQVVVAGKALDQARAGFDLARVRYNTGVSSRAGISPLLEVSDAQAALTLAEQNQVNALYDYNAARTQLDRSAGRLAYVSTGPGFSVPPAMSTVGATPSPAH
jgi:outer membrane protein TolC